MDPETYQSAVSAGVVAGAAYAHQRECQILWQELMTAAGRHSCQEALSGMPTFGTVFAYPEVVTRG